MHIIYAKYFLLNIYVGSYPCKQKQILGIDTKDEVVRKYVLISKVNATMQL